MMGMSRTSIMSKLPEKMQKDMRIGQSTMFYEDDQNAKAMADEIRRSVEPIEPDNFNRQSHKRNRPPEQGTNGSRASSHETWGEKIVYLEIPAKTVEVRSVNSKQRTSTLRAHSFTLILCPSLTRTEVALLTLSLSL